MKNRRKIKKILDSNVKLAEDYAKEVNTYFDKPFVRVLIKKVQDLDPDIAAIIDIQKKMIYFMKYEIIIDKILLDEFNLSQPIEYHINRIKSILFLLSKGFKIPSQVKKEAKNLNFLK